MKKLSCPLLILLFSAFSLIAQKKDEGWYLDHLNQFWSNFDHYRDTLPDKIGLTYFKNGKKEIIIYGTSHVMNGKTDFMANKIDSAVRDLKPTIILTESYAPIQPTRNLAIQNGDMSFGTYLGATNHIPVLNWCFDWEDTFYQTTQLYNIAQTFLGIVSMFDNSYYFNQNEFLNYEAYYKLRNSSLERNGILISPFQRQPAFYYKLYEKYYEKLFNSSTPLVDVDEEIALLEKNPLYIKLFASIQIQRELQLIKTLKNELQKHDRILILAGYVHKQSMDRLIPVILENANSTVHKNKKNVRSESSPKGKLLFIDEYPIHHNDADGNMVILDSLSSAFDAFQPDLVLTQGYFPIFDSAQKSLERSGNPGLFRYLSINHRIRIKSWLPTWHCIYYRLAGEYTDQEIYLNAFIFQFLEFRKLLTNYNFRSVEEMNDWIYESLWDSGYPFRPEEYLGTAYFYKVLESKGIFPDTNHTLDEFIGMLTSIENPKIMKRIQSICTERLLVTIQRNQSQYRRILIQGDKNYFYPLSN